MTVRELIEALGQLDQELTVIIPDLQSEFASPNRIIVDLVAPCADGGFELCDYYDDGVMTVARLMGPGEHDDRDERPKPAPH